MDARKGVAAFLAALASVLAAGLVSAADPCSSNPSRDFNGSCESSSNQVTCGTGMLPPGQPVGVFVDPSMLRAQAGACNDGAIPGAPQGRASVGSNRPHEHGGGVAATLDGDADNQQSDQGWYRLSVFTRDGYALSDCGSGDSFTEPGEQCGPDLRLSPTGGGPGGDYNGNWEDPATGQLGCGTGLLPGGIQGEIVEGIPAPGQPVGLSGSGSGSQAPRGEASLCLSSGPVQGRVAAAFNNQGAGAAYDGDPDSVAPRGWRRVVVYYNGQLHSDCGGDGSNSWTDPGSAC